MSDDQLMNNIEGEVMETRERTEPKTNNKNSGRKASRSGTMSPDKRVKTGYKFLMADRGNPPKSY